MGAKTSWTAALALASAALDAQGVTPVLTRSYDNARTGANVSETIFTPTDVLHRGLTKLFSLDLVGDDPRVEAQPLYVPGVTMNDGAAHDVVYVFSMSNNVWAFDANTGVAIWPQPVSLGPAFHPRPGDIGGKINKSYGILSTPVVDPVSGLMYVVNWLSDSATHQSRTLQVHALQLGNGQPPPGKAALPVHAQVTNAAGQTIALDQVQTQRAALLLVPLQGRPQPPAHKMLYVAFTGAEGPPAQGDPTKAHHGWVVAFDVDAWSQAAAWVATPNSFGGGIWHGSQGLAADEQGSVYAMTSNGGYVSNQGHNVDVGIGVSDFPESFVKLSYAPGVAAGSLTLADWFIPRLDSHRMKWNDSDVQPFPAGYDYTDQDLGSAGPVLPPGTKMVVGAGKDGVLFVLDRNDMGKAVGDFTKLKRAPVFLTFDPDRNVPAYKNASPTGDLDFKPMRGVKTHHLHGSPLSWRSSTFGLMLFAWGENGSLRAFAMDPNTGRTRLLAEGTDLASATLANPETDNLGGMPGAMMALSANGADHGIVWATAPVDGDANADLVAGAIRAYDATHFAAPTPSGNRRRLRKLWQQTGFTYSKFCPPVVADGKLFVPTYDGRVDVYALPARGARMRRPG